MCHVAMLPEGELHCLVQTLLPQLASASDTYSLPSPILQIRCHVTFKSRIPSFFHFPFPSLSLFAAQRTSSDSMARFAVDNLPKSHAIIGDVTCSESYIEAFVFVTGDSLARSGAPLKVRERGLLFEISLSSHRAAIRYLANTIVST